MNKIDKIIDIIWNANRDEDHNKIYYDWEVKKCMKQFGEICFGAGRAIGDINSIANFMKHQEYEDFLKEIENEEGN